MVYYFSLVFGFKMFGCVCLPAKFEIRLILTTRMTHKEAEFANLAAFLFKGTTPNFSLSTHTHTQNHAHVYSHTLTHTLVNTLSEVGRGLLDSRELVHSWL